MGDTLEIDLAVKRILLLYSIAFSVGGIPLIYLGDELGATNDYSYRADPARAGDSRWVHRPSADPKRDARRKDPNTIEGRIFREILHLIKVRKSCPALAGNEMEVIEPGNEHVFGYVRHHDGERVLVFANFSESEQTVQANQVRLYGLSYNFRDLISGEKITLKDDLALAPYRFMWLSPA